MPEREVLVTRFECVGRDETRASFEIECSSGTYIRSLIADLGDAYCDELRRTAIGPFSVADAGAEVALEDALAFLPARELSEDEAAVARHGVPLASGGAVVEAIRLVHEGRLLAIARDDGAAAKPYIVFPGS